MFRKKALLIMFIVLAASAGTVFGQVSDPTDVNANLVGTDTAQQMLKLISVSKFEDPGFWDAHMSPDQGIIRMRRFKGYPIDKEVIEEEEDLGIVQVVPGQEEGSIERVIGDEYVLGVKVQFFSRGYRQFAVLPVKPIPIEGICKTVSVWVVGRNFNHELTLLIQDAFGKRAEVPMGKLNFSGWKEMTVAIPPSVRQKDYHFSNLMGIKILGFRVDTDPAESYGSYYIYFDGLRAVTDLFAEQNRDVDDFTDAW